MEASRTFSLGLGLTNACNLACAHCYRQTARVDCLSLAQVRLACEALGASTARHRGVDRDALARTRPGLDRPDELVPEDQGAVEDGVADPPFQEPVPVRATEAHGRHSHDDLALAGLGCGLVVEPQIARAVEAEGFHERWP
jgi:hypothetical protein